jgi:hypothetical protein
VTLGHAEIGRLLPQLGEKRSVVSQRPNLLSIVLHVRLGAYPVLLGGDLETTPNLATGWDGVLRALVPPAQRGRLVKVPHHGSSGAHHPDMWANLLEPTPMAVTTTYNPSGLPRPEDRARLRGLAAASYLTGVPGGPKSKRRFKDRAASEAFPHDLRRVLGGLGHVRLRTRLDDPSVAPTVDLFGLAFLDSAA